MRGGAGIYKAVEGVASRAGAPIDVLGLEPADTPCGVVLCHVVAHPPVLDLQKVQFKNICLAEMWSSSEAGSYSRLIDCCITQLWAGD